MADQIIENIVDEIVDIVLEDLDITPESSREEDGVHTWFETNISDRQRKKLVDKFERLFNG